MKGFPAFNLDGFPDYARDIVRDEYRTLRGDGLRPSAARRAIHCLTIAGRAAERLVTAPSPDVPLPPARLPRVPGDVDGYPVDLAIDEVA